MLDFPHLSVYNIHVNCSSRADPPTDYYLVSEFTQLVITMPVSRLVNGPLEDYISHIVEWLSRPRKALHHPANERI